MGGDLQLIGEVELVVDGAPHLRLGLVAHLVRVRVRVRIRLRVRVRGGLTLTLTLPLTLPLTM